MMFGAILMVWAAMVLFGVALLGEADERTLYWRRKCEEARDGEEISKELAEKHFKRVKYLERKLKGKKK